MTDMIDTLSINRLVAEHVAKLPRPDGALRRRAERLKAGASVSARRIADVQAKPAPRPTPSTGDV